MGAPARRGVDHVSVSGAAIHSLWNWARRRHRNKNRHGIFPRYFHPLGNQNGMFSCKVKQDDGSIKQLCLRSAADIPIKRHVKIQGAATPQKRTSAAWS